MLSHSTFYAEKNSRSLWQFLRRGFTARDGGHGGPKPSPRFVSNDFFSKLAADVEYDDDDAAVKTTTEETETNKKGTNPTTVSMETISESDFTTTTSTTGDPYEIDEDLGSLQLAGVEVLPEFHEIRPILRQNNIVQILQVILNFITANIANLNATIISDLLTGPLFGCGGDISNRVVNFSFVGDIIIGNILNERGVFEEALEGRQGVQTGLALLVIFLQLLSFALFGVGSIVCRDISSNVNGTDGEDGADGGNGFNSSVVMVLNNTQNVNFTTILNQVPMNIVNVTRVITNRPVTTNNSLSLFFILPQVSY